MFEMVGGERAVAGGESGAVEVGKLLKQIYIDSALKKSEKLDKLHSGSGTAASALPPAKKISWNQYKASQMKP